MRIEAQLVSVLEHVYAQTHEHISHVGAAILASDHLDVAKDTRSFAAIFEIPHAIALRECVALGEAGLLIIEDKQERSGRLFFRASNTARIILKDCVTA